MTPTAQATQLRQRARHLRDLASSIEAMPAMRLDRHADDDTWRGRRPLLCRTLLATNQHQLHSAADDLRRVALRLDQQAEEFDAVARAGLAS
jgi:hypothetical protein